MGLKEGLLGAAKKQAAMAGQQIAAGLNRVDELGGDLRDYLLTREDQPLLRKAGERLARFGGITVEEEGKSPSELAHEAAAEAAPPPTAAEISAAAERKGLGDPDIAAQVYGRNSCPWTGRTITLFNDAKVDFDFIELDDSENGHFEGKLVAETTQSSVPFVYIRGEFVGGYNEVNEIVRLGELPYRILSAEDKKASDAVRQHVEIAAREVAHPEANNEADQPSEAPN
jgi:glutaredoxin